MGLEEQKGELPRKFEHVISFYILKLMPKVYMRHQPHNIGLASWLPSWLFLSRPLDTLCTRDVYSFKMEMLTQNQVFKKSEVTGMVLGKTTHLLQVCFPPFSLSCVCFPYPVIESFSSVKKENTSLVEAKTPQRGG